MEERQYDLIFICRPATPEEEIAKVIATIEHSATEHGGKVEKTEKWGTRRLAYRVAKHREGFYVYMVIRGGTGDIIKELERRLKVSDPVIKYQTIRLDEELKRQQKLVKHRERRASRRPRKQAAPGSTPAPAPPQQVPPPAEHPAASELCPRGNTRWFYRARLQPCHKACKCNAALTAGGMIF
jgi:small subunit ribosomal protein S6